MFKDVYKAAVGPENAAKYQTVGFAVSSACAEFIADIALCPFEAVSRNSPCLNKLLIKERLFRSKSESRLLTRALSPRLSARVSPR